MRYVVVVNGKPKSGKTTFEQMCKEYVENPDSRSVCHLYSSVDKVNDVMDDLHRTLGIKNVIKDDELRNLMAHIKEYWVNKCDGPLRYVYEKITAYEHGTDINTDIVYFVDIREIPEIDKLKTICSCLGFPMKTVFIDRQETRDTKHGNDADDNATLNIDYYDEVIYNSGTIDYLRETVESFINELLRKEEEK